MTVDVHRVRVYLDAAGEWRWQARDSNGRVVADSGEGYVDRDYTVDAATSLFPDAELDVED